jgi:hypothetical protein
VSETNKHGLSRYIPADVKRTVRQRCKFGCVLCRKGFYHYEHIDPPFENATAHDPDCICCLCAFCHDGVTRGHISKSLVKSTYSTIQSKSTDQVGPPTGPIDFHDGSAELVFGGLVYSKGLETVFRYHGTRVFRVVPGARPGEPGAISAVFTDDDGNETLRLEENEWIGRTDNWDIDITGPRISVKRKKGMESLRLRLDPPGRVTIENMDMRYKDAHILASETAFAAGRYHPDGTISWFFANIHITKGNHLSNAIEFTDPSELKDRWEWAQGSNASCMTDPNKRWILHGDLGVMDMELGITYGSYSNYGLYGFQCVSHVASLDKVRDYVEKSVAPMAGWTAKA